MIIFLNFAPIEFMGGAEKWMLETACYINSAEKTLLLSVSNNLSSIYGKLILHRSFDHRTELELHEGDPKYISITLSHFIPFTREKSELRKILNEARVIYIKFEILEVLIALYFGGVSTLSKIIGGMHSPFIYSSPQSFTDRLHNLLYCSIIFRMIMKKVKKIHVITIRDKQLLEQKFKLNNIEYYPNSLNINETKLSEIGNNNKLNILFVGELNKRKGLDIIEKLIPHLPNNCKLSIIGDGPEKEEVIKVCKYAKNCKYMGYIRNKEIGSFYRESDVLFLPSRAEGFPLVFHEAMIHGLLIVDSLEINVGLPSFIEYSSDNTNYAEYLNIFNKILQLKKDDKLFHVKEGIVQYYFSNIASKKIAPLIKSNLFNVSQS